MLTAFLGLAAGTAVVSSDPTEDLDPDMLTGRVEDGTFVPGYRDYIGGYVDSRGLSGASVSVSVPGGFCEVPGPTVIGTVEGEIWSRTLTSLVECDDGRVLVAVFEVVLCARATGASWRWWTPCCSSW